MHRVERDNEWLHSYPHNDLQFAAEIDEDALAYTMLLFEPAELEKFVYRVMETTSTGLDEIGQLHAARRITEIQQVAHRIKNPCSYLGARNLVLIFREMEIASKNGETDRIGRLLNLAWDKLEQFQHSFQDYRKQ